MKRFTNVYFFIDDSGVLDFSKNEKYFLYCGYMIIGSDNKAELLRKYNAVRDQIALQYPGESEIKGRVFDKSIGHELRDQLRLFKVMRNPYSYSLILEVRNDFVYDSILNDKKSKTRFKNYALKMIIKNSLLKAVEDGLIGDELLHIKVLIDEEGQSTNGIYNLEESIKSELFQGIHNFDYGTFHEPIFHNQDSEVDVTYCSSERVKPVQTADILANLCYYFLHEPGYDLRYFVKHENTIFRRLPF